MKLNLKGASILSASKRRSTFDIGKMSYHLFLDDERYPVLKKGEIFHIARNYDDAEWYVRNLGLPNHISFDHDLGSPKNLTGYDFAKWFCRHIEDNNYTATNLANFTFSVHSQNPVGAENIKTYMNNFLRHWCND
jgi:hypothetical protein